MFSLYRGGRKCDTLFKSGISEIKDIPTDFKLTDKQGIQLECAKSGRTHIDKEKIKDFLDSLKGPISYFLVLSNLGFNFHEK